jgi:hypothetical protein
MMPASYAVALRAAAEGDERALVDALAEMEAQRRVAPAVRVRSCTWVVRQGNASTFDSTGRLTLLFARAHRPPRVARKSGPMSILLSVVFVLSTLSVECSQKCLERRIRDEHSCNGLEDPEERHYCMRGATAVYDRCVKRCDVSGWMP